MAGKLFPKAEADKLFGPVLVTVKMDISQFKAILSQTKDNIMFRIVDGKLFILGDDRKPLYPAGAAIAPEDVYGRASVSIVNELLALGNDAELAVESRQSVTTATYGDNTIEELSNCPPFCW